MPSFIYSNEKEFESRDPGVCPQCGRFAFSTCTACCVYFSIFRVWNRFPWDLLILGEFRIGMGWGLSSLFNC